MRLKLCNKRPCRFYLKTCPDYPLIEIWSDHFHDGSTDVYLYEIVDDVVMLKNYPVFMAGLEEKTGYIGDARYMQYSCHLGDHPDPRKRSGLRLGLQTVRGGGCRYVTYDGIACKEVISHIRKALGIVKWNIETACDKQVTLFFDKREGMPYSIVGVKYLQDVI